MSKTTAKRGVENIINEIYALTKEDSTKQIIFRTPDKNQFDHFNSLRMIDSDSFSGVNVFLIESILWEAVDGTLCSSMVYNGEFGEKVYKYSSECDEMPKEFIGVQRKKYLIYGSLFLDSIDGDGFNQKLHELNVFQSDEFAESFFVFLCSLGCLRINHLKRDELVNSIAYQPRGENYSDTAINELFDFYENLFIYEIDENSPLKDVSIFWMSSLALGCNAEISSGYFNESARKYLFDLFDNNLWKAPADNIKLALTASHFKHCYLEIYRCIEWLYSIPRAKIIKDTLSLSDKAQHLAGLFREHLAWKRREPDSLALLTEEVDFSKFPMPAMEKIFGKDQIKERDGDLNLMKGKVAEYVYEIRNQFVHQFEPDKTKKLDHDALQPLILLLMFMVSELYFCYRNELC